MYQVRLQNLNHTVLQSTQGQSRAGNTAVLNQALPDKVRQKELILNQIHNQVQGILISLVAPVDQVTKAIQHLRGHRTAEVTLHHQDRAAEVPLLPGQVVEASLLLHGRVVVEA